jgi:hypothetical protein
MMFFIAFALHEAETWIGIGRDRSSNVRIRRTAAVHGPVNAVRNSQARAEQLSILVSIPSKQMLKMGQKR